MTLQRILLMKFMTLFFLSLAGTGIAQVPFEKNLLYPTSITATDDNGSIISFPSAEIAKIDSIGQIEWSKSYNTKFQYVFYSHDTGCVIVSLDSAHYKELIFKLDKDGNVQWANNVPHLSLYLNGSFFRCS
ncbi:MAG: hypothetical protein IPO63_04445 [Bacteroidetes bacterium]|nr:hypothetical protein [Bacteroidota bacterium]